MVASLGYFEKIIGFLESCSFLSRQACTWLLQSNTYIVLRGRTLRVIRTQELAISTTCPPGPSSTHLDSMIHSLVSYIMSSTSILYALWSMKIISGIISVVSIFKSQIIQLPLVLKSRGFCVEIKY
jgi:hypothetical protein